MSHRPGWQRGTAAAITQWAGGCSKLYIVSVAWQPSSHSDMLHAPSFHPANWQSVAAQESLPQGRQANAQLDYAIMLDYVPVLLVDKNIRPPASIKQPGMIPCTPLNPRMTRLSRVLACVLTFWGLISRIMMCLEWQSATVRSTSRTSQAAWRSLYLPRMILQADAARVCVNQPPAEQACMA